MKIRSIVLLVLVFTCSLFLTLGQAEEKYPNRLIELIVPMAPGGSSDLLARIFSEELARALNVPINVVNKAGGSGVQAAIHVTRAKKDGYTLFEGTSTSISIMPSFSKEANYDPIKEFITIGHFASVPSIISVRSDSPFQTLNDLIEYARKNPGKLKNSCVGFGEVSYLNLQLLAARNNIKITSIPFKGASEALPAYLGGHTDMYSSTASTLGPHIKSRKIRGLSVTSKQRLPEFPTIPTTAELGYPYVNLTVWLGLVAPAGVPQSVIDVLVPAAEKVFTNPDVAQRATKVGFTVDYMGPEEFRTFIKSDVQTVRKVLEDADLFRK